jgi:hypothetical protein
VLGKSHRTVGRWCLDGTLPAVKVGDRYVLRAADVATVAAKRNQGGS